MTASIPNLWACTHTSVCCRYFSAYRIDHILGFFRIWELPADSRTGLLGRFRPSVPFQRHELEGLGIWDFDRLCDPYVTLKLLEKLFDDEGVVDEIVARYFVEGPCQRYKFRSQYNSEAAIWALRPRSGFPGENQYNSLEIWKNLMLLRQNVVLLRDAENPDLFYPVS